MENKIDRSQFQRIKKLVFKDDSILAKYSIMIDGEDASFYYLRFLKTQNNSDIYARIDMIYRMICRHCDNGEMGEIDGRPVKYSQFHWARLCVSAYYFYLGDRYWLKSVFYKLEAKITEPELKDAAENAKKIIIKDYWNTRATEVPQQEEKTQKRQRLAKNVLLTPVIEQQEYQPDLLRALQDINSGKRKLSDIDWGKELQYIVRFWEIIPVEVPPILWLWGLLGGVDDPTTRIDVLEQLKNASNFPEVKITHFGDFYHDCDCLVKIYMRVRDFNFKNDAKVIRIWEGKQRCLNDISHILLDETIKDYDLPALANEIYTLNNSGKKLPPLLALMLRAFKYDYDIEFDNIVDYAKYIHLAEGYRQLILNGILTYEGIPDNCNLSRKIKKMCFDKYIECRIKQVEADWEKFSTSVDDPSEIDLYQKLLEIEQDISKNLIDNNVAIGSAVPRYVASDRKNLEIDTIKQFIDYLQKQITKKKNEAAVKRLSINKLINIENIENFALGDNVKTKIEEKK